MQPIHLLVADDENIEHYGIEKLLENIDLLIQILLKEIDCNQVIITIKKNDINFLILDINFNGKDEGKYLLPQLKKEFPALKIMVVTRQDSQPIFNAVGRYANGIMSKSKIDKKDFQDGIRHIWLGKDNLFVCKTNKAFLKGFEEAYKFRLDDREAKICRYFNPTCSIPRKQIAMQLGIDERRLSEILEQIAIRFGFKTFKEALPKLIEYGMI
jgi:DNA-binding NarL/FixJ family response regulator